MLERLGMHIAPPRAHAGLHSAHPLTSPDPLPFTFLAPSPPLGNTRRSSDGCWIVSDYN
jgi:hypothetical protein